MATRDSVKASVKKLRSAVGMESGPVDVEMVAKAVGATLTFEPLKEDLSGVLVKDKDRVVIGVNSEHPYSRQRFTIAHEIGHLVLKHQGELFIDHVVMRRDSRSAQAIDRQEIEANQFAAELLMPEDLVLQSAKKCYDQSGSLPQRQLIEQLAREFKVSPQAMEYRLTNLGIFMPE
jgi:Zn-dependent peptidase ImmA (M78 family)